MPPKPRDHLCRIMKRDDGVCGAHIEGCGRPIISNRDAAIGHRVHRSFFKSFPRARKAEFNADWNCQPECLQCNDRRGGQMVDWPPYWCRRHYLQVSRKGNKATVKIRETTTGSECVHAIGEPRTDPAKRIPGRVVWSQPWGHAFATRIRDSKLPPDGTSKGCSAFTRVAARMVARPPKAARFTEVLQAMSLPPLPAPIATGWSDSCRAGFAPAEGRCLSTAHC